MKQRVSIIFSFFFLILFIIVNKAATETLYFPHIACNSKWDTEICLINTSMDVSQSGNLLAFDNSGRQVSSVTMTLGPGFRQEIVVKRDIKDSDQIGYIVFETDSNRICGYTKFYVDSRYRVAIPATADINSGDIFIPHIASNEKWWTGISLLNTTAVAKVLTFEFSDGTIKTRTIAALEHQIFSIKQLFDNISQPGIKSAVIKNGQGMVGLELFGSNEGTGDNYLSGILLKDNTASHIFYPHIASNYVWWTGIVAYNPSDQSSSLTITPYQKDGTPLPLKMMTLAGRQKYIGTAKTLNFPGGSAWFKIDATCPITGFELFGTLNGRQLGGYTGVGISGASGLFPKIDKQGWTGIAFVNIEDKPSTITIRACDNSGTVIATETFSLSAFEKVVSSAGLLFSSNIDAATYIRYSSTTEIVGFQLNGSESGMLLDALPGDHFLEIIMELLTSIVVDDNGGTLVVDDFSLLIPSGIYNSPTDLSLYKMGRNSDFESDMVTDTFRLNGLPEDFPDILVPDLRYNGTLSDESYIVVGEEVFIPSLSAAGMAYHLVPASAEDSFLTFSGQQAATGQDRLVLNNRLSQAVSDSATTSRFLDFSGITGWKTHTTLNGNGHFSIQYPVESVTLSQAASLGRTLEIAYDTFDVMGFSYSNRTNWPVRVTLKKLKDEEYGLHCPSIWGHNSATLQFNREKLNQAEQIATTAGHEFFHLVQYLYDPRSVLPRAKLSAPHHWLNEACAVWAEEKFSSEPDYVSAIRAGHETSPFGGMHAPAVTGNAGHHGYGMSAFIKFLVNEYGEDIIRDIYLRIFDEIHPVEAINMATGSQLVILWEKFLREYVTGDIYGVGKEFILSITSGRFRIQSESDTGTSFTGNYPDLSAQLFLIRLDDKDIRPSKAVYLDIDQDLCDITLFKYKQLEPRIEYLSHSTNKKLVQKDLRTLTDDGYHLLVMVTQSNFFAPYTQTKPVKLDISIETTAAAMTLSAAPDTLDADGTATSTIAATVTDDTGNPVEGETVTFTTNSGSLSADSADTDANGIASVQYTAPASAPAGGISTITATTTNEVTATCPITINPTPTWPGWPAPQWCPITTTKGNHIIEYPNGNPDFVTCSYYGNGSGPIREEMPYYQGSPDIWGYRSRNGVEKQYFESGQLQIERPWQDNMLNGTERWYFESGQLQFEIPYVEDKKNGTKKEYHSGVSGYHLIHEIPYMDDKKNGIEKLYVYSGQLQSETPWQDDKINGIKKTYYYLTGQLHTETPYVDSMIQGLYKTYYESGQLWGETPYVDDKKNGLYRGYYESGQVWFETPYADDEKNGTEKEYYESGQVWFETPYADDEKNGIEREYYESGPLNVETSWQNGIKNGEEKFYNIDGDMVDCDIYENGICVGSCMP